MGRKIILSVKDDNGAYIRPSPAAQTSPSGAPVGPESSPTPALHSYPDPELSIDSLMKKGLLAIDRTMKSILQEISLGNPPRECIQNLKDCMAMLKDLKEREEELLDGMSDEDLEKAASNDNSPRS